MIFIRDQAQRLIVGVVRYCFSILLILVARKLQRIKSFSGFSAMVSGLEALAILLFFFILPLYDLPEFTIQSKSILLVILIVFVVPNRWENMLALAVVASCAYFLCAYDRMPDLLPREFFAAVSYAALMIVLCAVKAIGADRGAQREFAAKSRLEQASARDFLTNAVTRERLEEEARRWMSFCRRQGLPLCFVFADVDDLKHINDRYGHATGDAALREVAATMRNQLRNSDTIARWGGDEFVLVLPNVTLQNAALLLDRVKKAVNRVTLEGGATVSCSFGVAQMGPESDYAQMLSDADAMMYRAKQAGKGRVHFSDCAEGDAQVASF